MTESCLHRAALKQLVLFEKYQILLLLQEITNADAMHPRWVSIKFKIFQKYVRNTELNCGASG
jgi:hypothetical protein